MERELNELLEEMDVSDLNSLLNRMDELKQYLKRVERAREKIKKWHDNLPRYESLTKVALEGVMRIFEEEVGK